MTDHPLVAGLLFLDLGAVGIDFLSADNVLLAIWRFKNKMFSTAYHVLKLHFRRALIAICIKAQLNQNNSRGTKLPSYFRSHTNVTSLFLSFLSFPQFHH
jgi:hypothetical protein